jgi:putative PIN family toxin of toxin-antitoxin system
VICATLDTNVLVSGLASVDLPTSTPSAGLRHWRNGTFELVFSADILTECERAIAKPYYRSGRSPSQIAAAMRTVASAATIFVPTIAISGVASHPEDDLVLAAAASGAAKYLVTGDRQLKRLGVFQRIRNLAPREFLDFASSAER